MIETFTIQIHYSTDHEPTVDEICELAADAARRAWEER